MIGQSLLRVWVLRVSPRSSSRQRLLHATSHGRQHLRPLHHQHLVNPRPPPSESPHVRTSRGTYMEIHTCIHISQHGGKIWMFSEPQHIYYSMHAIYQLHLLADHGGVKKKRSCRVHDRCICWYHLLPARAPSSGEGVPPPIGGEAKRKNCVHMFSSGVGEGGEGRGSDASHEGFLVQEYPFEKSPLEESPFETTLPHGNSSQSTPLFPDF